MRRILAAALTIGVWTALAVGPEAPNTLTPQEAVQGWKLLFDGKTLNGWTPHGAAEWKIVNGAVTTNSSKGGALYSNEDYDNFVLKLEFQGTPDINSGVYIRMARQGNIHDVGYEIQIRDIDEQGYTTGSLVNMAKTTSVAKIIPGQWNRMEITAQGDHITVVYNGKKVLDTHNSLHSTGAIGLQWAHPERAPGKSIAFRNIKVRRCCAANCGCRALSSRYT